MKKMISEIIETIKRNKTFLILAHDNMDGDSLGSGLALCSALNNLKKKASMFINAPVPKKYTFLPGICKFITNNLKAEKIGVIFVLDTAGLNQLKYLNSNILGKNTIINIDHHVDNKKFGRINWVDPGASAVGEQIYALLKQMSVPITSNIAVCLYTAISTDTGSFKYSNTTPTTHRIIADLLSHNVFPHMISENVYENTPVSKLKLLRLALKTLLIKDRVIYMWITKPMLKKAGAKQEDTENMIDLLKSVENIKVAVVFKQTENPGEIRITLRSKDLRIHVNRIAREFGGGGHPAAAGCTIKGSGKEVEKAVIKAVCTFLKNKNSKCEM